MELLSRRHYSALSLLVGCFIILSVFLNLASCIPGREQEQKPDRVYRIGINSNLKSAPVLIADDRNFFKKEGVSVTVSVERNSIQLLQGLYAGDYDFVCVPSFLVVQDFLKGESCRILAVLNRNQSRYVMMNPDVVENPADLAGNSIGISPNSASEYVLTRFLVLHGVDSDSVTVKFYNDEALPGMLAAGHVDAILSWPPYTIEARELMDGRILVTNAQMGVDIYWLLVTREDISLMDADAITRVFKALDSSYKVMFSNPDAAIDLVSKRLSIPSVYLEDEWKDFIFMMEMPQSLVLVMEQQGYWLAERNAQRLDTERLFTMFDYPHLERVFPERVTIIR